jgi:hypothetical protein
VSVHAQNDSIPNTQQDTLTTKTKAKYGIRFGGDISKLGRSFFDDDYTGFEIQADYRIKKHLYIAAEIGFEEKNNVNDYLDIKTTGSYIKAGLDYNMYDNWLNMDNMIYSGFRLGFSAFSHDLNSFTVYNTSQYWAPQYTSTDLQEFNDLTAVWAEVIIGMKVQLFNNLYIGLNMQLKLLVAEKEPDNFSTVYIPGYNKTYDSSNIGAGFGYTISYRIPLYKK